MDEISVTASDLPWETPQGYPRGFRRKVLRSGPGGRPRVALVRLDAGFEMDAHAHDLAENHYVLDGMYESHGREYREGSYRHIPKQTRHGPFRSRSGALLLVFWEG